MKLGVCYYPEHWDEAGWADDAARMRALGLTHVRIGEFAWARLEPASGQYDWAWLDRAVETLSDAGLKIIMGTPTATPPKWLVDMYPDVLPCDSYGRPRRFGSRRHYSFSSQTYRRESARIVTAMAERYGDHPAIEMWQTDNEYGCHDTVESNDPDAQMAFRLWLAEKYQTLDALNAAWGTVFWSQIYTDFDQIDPPMATVTEANPAHILDWRRFGSDQVHKYNQMQLDILRAHTSGRDMTHNFMGHFTQFDHYQLGAALDLATWDSYPLGFLEQFWWDANTKQKYMRTGHPDFAGFHHDLYRGVSGGRFGVMEQQPGPVNWARYNPAPLPGMVMLWTLEAIAHGAELVSYFRWRQAPFAQEQMHAGLNRSDGRPDQASLECAQVVAVLEQLADLPQPEQADVALVYDYEADWAHAIQPQGQSFRHDELCLHYYSALRRLGLNIDIVSPDAPVDGYKLVVVPSNPMLTAAQCAKLRASVAHIVFGPRTGSKTVDFQIPETCAPGVVQSLLPIRITRVESLRPGYAQVCGAHTVTRWLEHVASDEMLSDDGIIWADTKATYIAAWIAEDDILGLLQERCRALGIAHRQLPDGLRLRVRGPYLFVLNYGAVNADYASSLPSGATRITDGAASQPGQIAIYRI